MDTRLQEGIIGFLLFVVGKENQTANFICKWGSSLMCKTVVSFFLLFLGGGGGGGGVAWHTCHCNKASYWRKLDIGRIFAQPTSPFATSSSEWRQTWFSSIEDVSSKRLTQHANLFNDTQRGTASQKFSLCSILSYVWWRVSQCACPQVGISTVVPNEHTSQEATVWVLYDGPS